MVNDVLPTNNTAITPGTPRTLQSSETGDQLVKISLIEYLILTLNVTSLDISRNIVTQSVMRPTNTGPVKRTFVITRLIGFHNKLTPSFLILTTVRVPV